MKFAPTSGKIGKKVDSSAPATPGAGGADAPGQREHAVRVDAHQARRFLVGGGRLERRAEPRALQEPPDDAGHDDRADARDELRQAELQARERDLAADDDVLDRRCESPASRGTAPAPRNRIIKPKVVKICDSIGARMMRLITTW